MRARMVRGLALVAVLAGSGGCNAVLGIEPLEAENEAAGADAGGDSGGAGSADASVDVKDGGSGGAGGGGHAGDASVEKAGGGGGSGGGADDAGDAGGFGGSTDDAGDAGGFGGSADDAGDAGDTEDAGGSGGGEGCTGGTCSLPNAVGICAGGVCKIDHCALHYEDCDSVDSNGCEASLWTDPENCNGCGNKCSAANGTSSCVSGACKIACGAGFDDCDGDVANGCERPITDDVANCGACNAACTVANGTPKCTGTTCGVAACAGSWADCDGQYGNGCEANTTTDTGNCGACGAKCATGEVCASGKCGARSCVGGGDGLTNCGDGGSGSESCCLSLPVPGGTVQLDTSHSATVSDYKLDKYQITVGRFRKFVDAVVGGWTPAAGSGKHTHLNGGSGLSNGSGGYEPGWNASWNTYLPNAKGTWDSNLTCVSGYQTWTSGAGSNEKRPINCATWYEAAAFCIWDGGFLPSEAEWQYAAAGGSEGRQYPWSVPPGSTTIDCSYANYYNGGHCWTPWFTNVGSESPKGNGKWGQADLAGNVREWVLDWHASPYSLSSSTNYANTTIATYRVGRGGSFADDAPDLLASDRSNGLPTLRHYIFGSRCARTP